MGEILELFNLLLEHGYITIPLILWILWAWYNWRIFHNKNSEKYDDACDRRLDWLNQDRWSNLYINWLSMLLDKVSTVIGDGGQGRQNQVSLFFGKYFGFDHNPWTEPSFNLLFRIALVYPILSFMVFWLMGGSGAVGNVELLPDDIKLTAAQRWVIGIGLFAGLFGLFVLIRWLRSLSGWKAVIVLSIVIYFMLLIAYQFDVDKALKGSLTVLVFVLMIMLPGGITGYVISWLFLRDWQSALVQVKTTMWDISVAVAFAVAFAVAGAGAVAVAFTGAFAVAVAFTGAFAVAVAVAFTGAVAVAILYQNALTRHWASRFWLVYLMFMLWIVFISIQATVNNSDPVLLMFWLVFPLLNVPLDWLSLGVTRGLLQSICSGTHPGLRGFYWAVADVVIAFLLLFLMAAILLTAVEFANDLRLSAGKEIVLDLGNLLRGMAVEPTNPDFYWIYFMLFSTLLPTLVHFALAGASVVLWFPAKIRHALVQNWQNDADKKLEIWFYVSIMPVLGFVVAPSLLLYSLWWLLNTVNFGTGLIHFFLYFVDN